MVSMNIEINLTLQVKASIQLIIHKILWVFLISLYGIFRDWCKKNWTGLDSTIKMDIFSIFWLPLLLHSHIGTLIFPGAYQNSFLSLRVLRNTLGSIGTPRTQIQRFSKEPLSVKWPLAPKPLKRLLFFIKDGQF